MVAFLGLEKDGKWRPRTLPLILPSSFVYLCRSKHLWLSFLLVVRAVCFVKADVGYRWSLTR